MRFAAKTPDATSASGDDAPPTAPAVRLRLLTLNIHKGFSALSRRFVLPELRDAIRSASADVVCLQEVVGEHRLYQTKHLAWPATSQYEFLADSIWNQHAYGCNAVYSEGHHGNAVLSRYPIVRSENRDISVGQQEQRGILHCELSLPADKPALHLLTVHLGLRENHRQQQLLRLCDHVAERIPANAPLVIAGDFNDWRGRAHAVLADRVGLVEVYRRHAGRSARSFPARWPLLRLDRIYIRNVQAAEPLWLSGRPWSHLSDHLPIGAELQL